MEYQVPAEPPRAGSSNLRVSFNPSAFGQTGGPQEQSSVQPTSSALKEHSRISLRAALTEIEELKQSQRCVEISLAKQIEENEQLTQKLQKQMEKTEEFEENYNKQVKENQEQAFAIDGLNKKIQGFSKNQGKLSEKNAFKASSYMGEINERETELNAARDKLIEQDEEMRQLSVGRQKLSIERDYLMGELNTLNLKCHDLQTKYNDQARLLHSVVSHSKNPAVDRSQNNILSQSLLNEDGQNFSLEDNAREESMRADRIARQMNRSSFMGLGENPPKLMSEQDPTQMPNKSLAGPGQGGVFGINSTFQDKDQSYLTDDSVPSGIYALIDQYRQKARGVRAGDQLALMIDDFFGEAHAVMKDSHLRELARMKNENAVEVTKLKRVIEKMGESSGQGSSMHAPDHHTAFKVQASFADNEVERQRRLLIEENEKLNRRLRGAENILASKTMERKQFMEGASWTAKKAQIEAERHVGKVVNLAMEFDKRTQLSCVDPNIRDFDGQKVVLNKDWIKQELLRESSQLNANYKNLFQSVNYELSKAVESVKR